MTNNVLLDVYQSLLDGKNKSAALNMAQLIHINKTKSSIEANPNFWAGLIFTGSDGTVTLFKKEKNQPWLYGFFVLVLVIVIWYFNKGEHRS